MFEDEKLVMDNFAMKVQKKDFFVTPEESSNYKQHNQYNPYVNNNGTVLGNFIIF